MKQYINNKLVDLTPEEKTIREEERKKYQEYKKIRKDIETNIANNKASGKQKLKDLGLNDDEIQALIGA
tara:strand:- start:226 stop:432 length:207 start_codon:yes stop_codon:yes gene_type:complete